MTTQVTKISSTIAKSVAAAVLVAACTATTFADTQDYLAHENANAINVAQTKLMSSLNTAISLSTGVANVPAHLSFSANYGKQIKLQAKGAVTELQAEMIANNTEELLNELTASFKVTTKAVDNVIYAKNDTYTTILPSIASIGAEYEAKMQRAIQTAALQTIDYALNINFATTGNLE